MLSAWTTPGDNLHLKVGFRLRYIYIVINSIVKISTRIGGTGTARSLLIARTVESATILFCGVLVPILVLIQILTPKIVFCYCKEVAHIWVGTIP